MRSYKVNGHFPVRDRVAVPFTCQIEAGQGGRARSPLGTIGNSQAVEDFVVPTIRQMKSGVPERPTPPLLSAMAEEDAEPSGSVAGVIDDPSFPPTPHLERLYAEVKARLDLQRAEFDDLQRIVAIVLAAGGVVLGFAGAQFPGVHANHAKFWLFLAAVVVLALDIVAGGAALWPRGEKTTAQPGPLVDGYLSVATNVMLYDLITAARQAYEINEAAGPWRLRSDLVRLQLLGLGGGAVLLAAGVVAPHL